MWTVTLRKDIVRGQWNEKYHAYVHWEFFYILAHSGTERYIHYYDFCQGGGTNTRQGDDYDRAAAFVERIRKAENFTPEGKPGVWRKITDTRPLRPHKRRIYLPKEQI